EADRIDVPAQRDRVERHAARLELAGELPGAGLVLVQHHHADVPAPLPQVGQQREEVRLGAGDAGDLLQMEDRPRRHAESTRSAQESTEWPASTVARSACPIRTRS